MGSAGCARRLSVAVRCFFEALQSVRVPCPPSACCAAVQTTSAQAMAPKQNTQPPRAPEWMERTYERTRDPLPAASAGDRGAKRWQEAGSRFDADLKRGRVPDLPGMPAAGVAGSSGGPSPAPGGGRPADLKRLMTEYARTVLSMKPASLDPFAYTKIIRGRPVQAFLFFSPCVSVTIHMSVLFGRVGGRAGSG